MPLATSAGDTLAEPHDFLAVLGEAIGRSVPDAARRVIASADARSPDEGLALLSAYVSIADCRVRQAILDAVLAITVVEDKVEA